jgi:hypothetical protein
MSMRHGDYKFYENFEFFGNFGNLEIFWNFKILWKFCENFEILNFKIFILFILNFWIFFWNFEILWKLKFLKNFENKLF